MGYLSGGEDGEDGYLLKVEGSHAKMMPRSIMVMVSWHFRDEIYE